MTASRSKSFSPENPPKPVVSFPGEDTRPQGFGAYELPPIPSLADYRAGGERRLAFRKYWFREYPSGLLDHLVFSLFRLLPITASSAFGGFIGRMTARKAIKANKPAWRRTSAALKRLRPDIPLSEHEQRFIGNRETFGRMYAEAAKPWALIKGGFVEITGEEVMEPVRDVDPLVLIGLHIDNWEVAAAAATSRGYKLHSFYEPPKQRSRRNIIIKSRALAGCTLLEPTARGMMDAMAVLRKGGNVVLFCDELGPDRVSRAPFFWKQPNLDGNLAFAARIARKTGARVIPYHVKRGEGCHMTLVVGPQIALDAGGGGGDQLRRDVLAINAAIEPIILANLDHWYWIDNKLE